MTSADVTICAGNVHTGFFTQRVPHIRQAIPILFIGLVGGEVCLTATRALVYDLRTGAGATDHTLLVFYGDGSSTTLGRRGNEDPSGLSSGASSFS